MAQVLGKWRQFAPERPAHDDARLPGSHKRAGRPLGGGCSVARTSAPSPASSAARGLWQEEMGERNRVVCAGVPWTLSAANRSGSDEEEKNR